MLRPLVGVRFQVLFHSSDSKYFSPFPYGTSSLSVSEEYLALPDGAGDFMQNFSGFALLRVPLTCYNLCLQDYHLVLSHFPESSA